MKTTIQNFYNKWNKVDCEDWLGCVSPTYHEYQKAFFRAMKAICKDLGATIVNKTYGHYFESVMIERNGHYVYIHQEHHIGGRAVVDLTDRNRFLIRTAAHASDWRGGSNDYVEWKSIDKKLDEYLKKNHVAW
jgi:hypothetical protein